MRNIKQEMANVQALSAGLQLGMYEPIDLFKVPDAWCLMFDGLQCCLQLLEADLNPNKYLLE